MTFAAWRIIGVVAAVALTSQSPALARLEAGMVIDRSVTVRPGTYRLPVPPDLAPLHSVLQVISDEGVRIWMDGAMILDDWAPHESKVSRVPIAGGPHRFKVEYYDITGFAELRFDIQRK